MFRIIFGARSGDKRHFCTKLKPAKTSERKWRSVVGLEVHAQIASESKLFSGSSTEFRAPINSAVSFFDAAIPGTLPVLNRKCVELAIKTSVALGCRVNEVSMFDRKHYFYADLPAGYQITQQRAALANDGEITFPVIVPGQKLYNKTVRLSQLQLEQDSGKSLHDDLLKRSLIDLNRAGVPLMELVFAPDLETGEEAASLIKELVLILKRLETCTCKMEEGALRVDANVSLHKGGEPLGIRTEVKNISSLRSISQAISYEIQRQLEIVEQGGMVVNETLSWDAERRCTVVMRDKEIQQDYRFMPEPNLPPLRLDLTTEVTTGDAAFLSVPAISKSLPELPEQTRNNLIDNQQLKRDMAIILVNEPVLLDFFEKILSNVPAIPSKTVANFLINDLLTFCNKANINVAECKLNYKHLEDILKSLQARHINLQAARLLLELQNNTPDADISMLIAQHDLKQITDATEIEKLCLQAIEKQAKAVQQYQSGKSKGIFTIIGEVAKLSQQKADMKLVAEKLEQMLRKE